MAGMILAAGKRRQHSRASPDVGLPVNNPDRTKDRGARIAAYWAVILRMFAVLFGVMGFAAGFIGLDCTVPLDGNQTPKTIASPIASAVKLEIGND